MSFLYKERTKEIPDKSHDVQFWGKGETEESVAAGRKQGAQGRRAAPGGQDAVTVRCRAGAPVQGPPCR